MSTHTRTTTTSIDAKADDIWRVLDADFVNVKEWGPGVISSAPNPATPNGLNGSPWGGRVCQVEGLGQTDERIVAYDAESRTLSYNIRAENLPSLITSMQNTWTVTPDGPNRSLVDTAIDVTIDDNIMNETDAAAFVDNMLKGAVGAAQSLRGFVERN